jgi:hypothetical protein
MASLLPRLAAAGLDGVEAWHPNTTVHESERLVALAAASGLCVSAGSDYHGEGRRDRKLGRASGDIKITANLFNVTPRASARNLFDGNLRQFIAALAPS